jgi:hypothetical protein
MNKTVWISYDLGVKGDYEGLYSWLDNHNAKECGNSVAVLKYDYLGNFLEELQKDMAQSINLARHDRIYVVWRTDHKIKGQFLFGKRKAASWSGFGSQEPQTDEEL